MFIISGLALFLMLISVSVLASPIVGVDIQASLIRQQALLDQGKESSRYNEEIQRYNKPNSVSGRYTYNMHHSPFSRRPLSFQIFFPGPTNADEVQQPRPWNNVPSSNQPPAMPRTTTTERPSETETTQGFYRCMNGCFTTPEYNPVCGTDGETYSNRQRLRCAMRCGKNIRFVRQGACVSPAALPVSCKNNPACQ